MILDSQGAPLPEPLPTPPRRGWLAAAAGLGVIVLLAVAVGRAFGGAVLVLVALLVIASMEPAR